MIILYINFILILFAICLADNIVHARPIYGLFEPSSSNMAPHPNYVTLVRRDGDGAGQHVGAIAGGCAGVVVLLLFLWAQRRYNQNQREAPTRTDNIIGNMPHVPLSEVENNRIGGEVIGNLHSPVDVTSPQRRQNHPEPQVHPRIEIRDEIRREKTQSLSSISSDDDDDSGGGRGLEVDHGQVKVF